MTIDEIIAKDPAEAIELLKQRVDEEPQISQFEKQWNIENHDINDPSIRKNRIVKKTKIVNGDEVPDSETIENVSRVALALQKLIVNRAAAFSFGKRPEISSETKLEGEINVLNACKKVLKDIKDISHNKRMAKSVMRFTEAAEYWFPRPGKNNMYGFDSEFKIKCQLFSAENGDSLYPLFDQFGDLIAFSRLYKLKVDSTEKEYFETYTKDYVLKWENVNGTWTEIVENGLRKINTLGKIPIVYIKQPVVEWSDVQNLIDELEILLSRFSDTVAYHGSPKIFITGDIKGFAKKGEEGAVIQGGKESTASYLSWPFAPDAVKLEIDTLLRMIYTITQTPDISFDSIKGINQISGVALKLLFLDAHLKVEDKKEIFVDMLQRRMNIIKAYIGKINTKLEKDAESLSIDVDINPYMPGDLASDIQNLTNATGGKAILSQKTAVKMSGLVDDGEAEYKQITAEESASNIKDLFNPSA